MSSEEKPKISLPAPGHGALPERSIGPTKPACAEPRWPPSLWESWQTNGFQRSTCKGYLSFLHTCAGQARTRAEAKALLPQVT